MTNYTTYYNKFQELQENKITETEWKEFTDKIFAEILQENKEMLVRFQNEWAE